LIAFQPVRTEQAVSPAYSPSYVRPAWLAANPTAQEVRSVTRFPQELRLHPAFESFGGMSIIDELNYAERLKDEPIVHPVTITRQGIILAGFGQWRIALREAIPEIRCIEHSINEDEALSFILSHHRTRRQWNRFVLIRLALTLEPAFQEKAYKNMQAGGRFKGSAKLPDAQHIDVREKIANLAGVSARYITDVKAILTKAHPQLTEALTNGILSIPGAMRLIMYPKTDQLERFTQQIEEKNVDRVIKKYVKKADDKTKSPADVVALLETLLKRERQQPGSIKLRQLRRPGADVFVIQTPLTSEITQGELK
jgi:hypothetical protein